MLIPVKWLSAEGVCVPFAESESEPAITDTPSPTDARVFPPALASTLAMVTVTPPTLSAVFDRLLENLARHPA